MKKLRLCENLKEISIKALNAFNVFLDREGKDIPKSDEIINITIHELMDGNLEFCYVTSTRVTYLISPNPANDGSSMYTVLTPTTGESEINNKEGVIHGKVDKKERCIVFKYANEHTVTIMGDSKGKKELYLEKYVHPYYVAPDYDKVLKGVKNLIEDRMVVFDALDAIGRSEFMSKNPLGYASRVGSGIATLANSHEGVNLLLSNDGKVFLEALSSILKDRLYALDTAIKSLDIFE